MVTFAPSCTYASAIARPIPRPAPVTIATFPSSFPISVSPYIYAFLSLQDKQSARFSHKPAKKRPTQEHLIPSDRVPLLRQRKPTFPSCSFAERETAPVASIQRLP